jgi:serine phosphatase RsbU (regulator of sigma subunit)
MDTVDLRVGQRVQFGKVVFTLVGGSSFDRITSQELPMLSPPGSIVIQRIESSPPPGLIGVPGTMEETDANVIAAITQAAHLLVLPNMPMDAVGEICGLTMIVVPWRRAVVLVCSDAESQPVVFLVRGNEESTGGMLLLNEEAWEVLRSDKVPLLLESEDVNRRISDNRTGASPTLLQALVIPIMERGKVVGGLYLEMPKGAVVSTEARLKALMMFADLLSLRIGQAHHSRSLRDQQRLQQEVAIAARVQQKMLSNARFDGGGYSALARQIPCYEVGGDLYDISTLTDGKIILALGDVSGKGMGAAMMMSNVVATLRALYDDVHDPSELAGRLHGQLLSFTEPYQFATLFLGVLHPTNHELEYVNAGHCPPFLLTRRGLPVDLASNGPPLGLIPGTSYTADTVEIPDGSLLGIFSDGVLEASFAGEFYGEERLANTLRGSMDLSPQELLDRIVHEVREFTQEQPLDDDMTLMVLRREAQV